jgi:putative transposase
MIASGGYQGPKMAAAVAAISREWEVEIVTRPELRKFVVLPKRWIVDRSFASGSLREPVPQAGQGF